jgi:hypothetical protein
VIVIDLGLLDFSQEDEDDEELDKAIADLQADMGNNYSLTSTAVLYLKVSHTDERPALLLSD